MEKDPAVEAIINSQLHDINMTRVVNLQTQCRIQAVFELWEAGGIGDGDLAAALEEQEQAMVNYKKIR